MCCPCCGGSKRYSSARKLRSGSFDGKEPLPAKLATQSTGKFQSSLPPVSEGRRDFARIFFADQRKIYFFAPGMQSMRPLQPTAGPSSAHIGDMSDLVVERATSLFGESLQMHLKQALGSA